MTLVERVARAIAETDLDFQGEPLSMNATRDDITRLALAALRAMREPTEGMVEAAICEAGPVGCCSHTDATARETWQTMIDAAIAEYER